LRALPAREDRLMALPSPVDAYVTAYNARKVEDMLACLTSDIRFTNILEGTVTAETCGLTAFAALARQSAAAFAHRTQTVLNAISVDDTTLVEVAFSAIVAKDLPNGWTAGKTVAVMGTSLFQLQQGKIARIVDQHG